MKKYRIPVSWTVDSIVDIRAECLGDAIEAIIDKPLPSQGVFRPGSFSVHQEDAQVEVPAHFVDADVAEEEEEERNQFNQEFEVGADAPAGGDA